MKLDIDVIQEDIDRGIPSDEHQCPIARAVRRIRPEVEYVTVAEGHVCLVTPEFRRQRLQGDLNDQAKEFVAAFDELEPVQPFTFSVDLELKEGWALNGA